MITSEKMCKLEDYADSKGISPMDLMENAGRMFVKSVKDKFDIDDKKVVVFAGTGNNAGDGFVAARYFAEENPVIVLLFGDPKKLKEEAMKNFVKLETPINIVVINTEDDLKQFHFQNDANLLLVDALLGRGTKGDIRSPISFGMDLFNSTSGIKVAVDVPSGMDPDTGKYSNKFCDVEYIVTFHDLKIGMEKVKDKTVVVDIGIPVEGSESKGNGDKGDDINGGSIKFDKA